MIKNLLTKNFLSKHRVIEEKLYEQVAEEMSIGHIRKGLWTKAFSKAGGSEDVAKSIYIKLRVQSLIDEARINDELADEINKKISKSITSKPKPSQLESKPISQRGIASSLEQATHKDQEPVESFNLSKIKSALMRDDVDYIEDVLKQHGAAQFLDKKSEIIEFIDLFEPTKSKAFLDSIYKK